LRRSTSLRVCLPGAPEITTIKVHNTEQAIRNVFVLNDRFLIVFEYNKAQTVTHHAFYVVRYLTLELSLALYQYLVYIRPFADFLRSQLGLGHLRSNEFLFEDPHRKKRHLSPVQATDILRRVTASFPTTMTLALYRQASKAIAKRYITELMKRINLYEPSRATDPRNLLAMGAGHHTKTLLTAYAIDSAYPTRLQPELLELYRRLSTLWQEWNEQYYRDHCHLWVKSNLPTNNIQTPEPASSTRKGSPNPLKQGWEIEEPPRHTSPQPIKTETRALHRYLQGHECRRTCLSAYLDLESQLPQCIAGEDVTCDVCSAGPPEAAPPEGRLGQELFTMSHTGSAMIQRKRRAAYLELSRCKEDLLAVQGTCLLCRGLGEP
jgi:hypothetical protein